MSILHTCYACGIKYGSHEGHTCPLFPIYSKSRGGGDMPKATLTFELPEDHLEFKWATNGAKYLTVLQDLYNEFRSRSKHHAPETTWGDVYDLFRDTLNENGIDPWEEG